jgi:hypothetical protein
MAILDSKNFLVKEGDGIPASAKFVCDIKFFNKSDNVIGQLTTDVSEDRCTCLVVTHFNFYFYIYTANRCKISNS